MEDLGSEFHDALEINESESINDSDSEEEGKTENTKNIEVEALSEKELKVNNLV